MSALRILLRRRPFVPTLPGVRSETELLIEEIELLKRRWDRLSPRLQLTYRQLRKGLRQTLLLVQQRAEHARSLNRAWRQLRHTRARGCAISDVFSSKKPN